MPPEHSGLGFGAFADDYDRYRPGYPEQFWGLLGDRFDGGRPGRLVDVGAGTGRVAVEAALRWPELDVLAIDPDVRMLERARRTAERRGARLQFVSAGAETLPLIEASVDVITVAQAFHWFQVDRAIPAFCRALRPGGGLVLVWNVRRNDRSAFLQDYEAWIDRVNPRRARESRTADVLDLLAAYGDFRSIEEFRFEWEIVYTKESFLGFASTPSYVRSSVSGRALGQVLEELGRRIDAHFSVGAFSLPYETRVYLAARA